MSISETPVQRKPPEREKGRERKPNISVLCKNDRNVFLFLCCHKLQEYYMIIFKTERNRVVSQRCSLGSLHHKQQQRTLYLLYYIRTFHTPPKCHAIAVTLLLSQMISHTQDTYTHTLTKEPQTAMLFHCLSTDDTFQTKCQLD